MAKKVIARFMLQRPLSCDTAKIGAASRYLGGMAEYELRPVGNSDEELDTMARLLCEIFPSAQHFTPEVLRWQYKENPAGAAVGFNAWAGTELAAHYVAIPKDSIFNGTPEKGLLSLNTATHPAHQGKGLFTKLAKATYELAADQGFGSVIGVANANSTHGFTKKLGFALVSPLRAMIGLGKLPLGTAADVRYAPVWDERTLLWRMGHPAYKYTQSSMQGRTLILSQRRQTGARYVLGLREGTVPEKLVPVEQAPPLAKVWIGLDPAMRWRGSAFINIPMRFRPSPLNLIFKDLTGQARMFGPGAVRFDAMDFDVL